MTSSLKKRRNALSKNGSGRSGLDDYLQLKMAVDRYFRLEHMLFRSSEPMTQEALDAAVTMFHDARKRCLLLSGITETEQ